MTKINVAYTE